MHAIAALLMSVILGADPPEPQPQAPPDAVRLRPQRHWYGWQILAAGGGSLTLGVVGLAIDDGDATPVVAGLGAFGYFVSGPIVHWAHGHGLRGLLSLGLNVGIPFVCGVIGGVVASAMGGSNHAMGPFTLGFIYFGLPVGVLAAVIVDAAVLAYDERPPSGPSVGVSLGPDRIGVGVRGTF